MTVNTEDIRNKVVSYLKNELIGPRMGDNEILEEEPHRRYLSGVLYPRDSVQAVVTQDEEEDVAGAAFTGDSNTASGNQADDPIVLANQYLPSSMGLSFYVRGACDIQVLLKAGRYTRVPDSKPAQWVREAFKMPKKVAEGVMTPDVSNRCSLLSEDNSVEIRAIWRPGTDGWLVTVTVINQRELPKSGAPDAADCLFQVELTCKPGKGGRITVYPRTSLFVNELEEQMLDVLYRKQRAYAIGHGCSADWEKPRSGSTTAVYSRVMPEFPLAPVDYELPGFDNIRKLSYLMDGCRPRNTLWLDQLDEFVSGYESWISRLPAMNPDIEPRHMAARDELMRRMSEAAARMRTGVQLLKSDEMVRRAFCLANRAMLMQMVHADEKYGGKRHKANSFAYVEPQLDDKRAWRPFQLAFQLLILKSLVDPSDAYHDLVDLIWFPTGGGKTEAYLAATAIQIFHRRLKHGVQGAGTTVIMRYTLRLLTAQQFRRASALICACELLRRSDPDALGTSPIQIGLWVGGVATPNRYQDASKRFDELRNAANPENPFQFDLCPWCGTELIPEQRSNKDSDYGFTATETSFEVHCPTATCPFNARLPVQVVDEQLYDDPPTLLLATVDKFARITWEERVGNFFGRKGSRPPDLIIQDELHLISGPLGTIVGLYEMALDGLISLQNVRPKFIASTATIRRADQQCLGLYARDVRLFPPSGLDSKDSYFARLADDIPGRLYVGIMAAGHTGSTALIRATAALLQAPIDLNLRGDELDAYWTLVAYHNSLRELGKTLTFAVDDIPARIKVIAADQSRLRRLSSDNVDELTSNIDARKLGGMLLKLERTQGEPDNVSMLICSNMLSVGIDVQRLGMMVVNGQPKSTAEYIQATSRVGRRQNVPGLVVCMYSPTKPRDRSHYERFVDYHSSLYRYVEPTSVTPFAQPARKRALHAMLVALVRHGLGLPADDDASSFSKSLLRLDWLKQFVSDRVALVDSREAPATMAQLETLIDEWAARAQSESNLKYAGSNAKQLHRLLRNMGSGRQQDPEWETLQSMRNVDRDCWIGVID